jgi:hypothetical protein
MEEFTDYLFDDTDQVPKAALILKAIPDARSPRLSELPQQLPQLQDDPTFPGGR